MGSQDRSVPGALVVVGISHTIFVVGPRSDSSSKRLSFNLMSVCGLWSLCVPKNRSVPGALVVVGISRTISVVGLRSASSSKRLSFNMMSVCGLWSLCVPKVLFYLMSVCGLWSLCIPKNRSVQGALVVVGISHTISVVGARSASSSQRLSFNLMSVCGLWSFCVPKIVLFRVHL